MEHQANANGQSATFSTHRNRDTPSEDLPDRAGAGGLPGGDLIDYLDRLTDRIDQLEFTIVELSVPPEDADDAEGGMNSRLSRIEERLEALAAHQPPAPDFEATLQTALTPLVERVEALGTASTATPGPDAPNEDWTKDWAKTTEEWKAFQQRMTEMMANLSDTADTREELTRIVEATATLPDQMDSLATSVAKHREAFEAQMTTALTELGKTLSDHQPDAEVPPAIAELQAGIDSLLEDAEAKKAEAAAKQKETAQLRLAMETFLKRFEHVAKTVTADTSALQEGLTEHVGQSLRSAAEQMQADIEGKLAPAISDGLVSVTDRINAAEKRLGSALRRKQVPLPALEEIQARLAYLSEQIAQVPAETTPAITPEDLSTILGALMKEHLDPARDEIGKIGSAVDRIADRPAPEIDLTEQRADLAQFKEALSDGVDRMETTVTTAFNAPPQWAADLASKMAEAGKTKIEELQSPLAALQEELRSGFGEVTRAQTVLTTQLAEVSADNGLPDRIETIAGAIDALRTELGNTANQAQTADRLEALTRALEALQADMGDRLGNLAKRADPVLDLTPQRQSFARFSTVLGQVVARLEAVAETMSKDTPQWAATISKSLEDLRADQTPEQHDMRPQLDEIAKGLEDLRGFLANLGDQSAVVGRIDTAMGAIQEIKTDLRSVADANTANPRSEEVAQSIDALGTSLAAQISTLAARPDPVLDLTPQRQSFARFNTASGQFLRRLEGLVASLATEYIRFEQRLTEHLAQHDGGPSDTHSNPERLIDTVARLAETNGHLVGLASASPDIYHETQEKFIRDLRSSMAEFIANAEKTWKTQA